MRRALALLLALSVGCAPVPLVSRPTPSPTREPGTVQVTAFLDLSGPRQPRGDGQRDALTDWVDRQTGAVRVKLRIIDVAGSDARLLLELRRAVVEDGADAVIVGVPQRIDDLQGALAVARLPVLFTLPVDEPASRPGDGGQWAFGLAPTPLEVAAVAVRDAAARGALAPAVLVVNDDVDPLHERLQLAERLIQGQGVRPTIVRAGGSEDAASRLRAMLPATRTLFFAGATAAYLSGTRLIPQPAAAGPLIYVGYLTEVGDLTPLREIGARWPGSRALTNPSSEVLRAYVSRHGTLMTAAASAYDALTIVAAAAERGAADRGRLRDQIESGTVAGIATTYRFSAFRHAGFASEDLVLLSWDGTRLVIRP